jgi:copper chaperone NosL
MKKLMGMCLLSLMLACSSEPEPIVYGTDACHTCKMTLMDKKFGAELVTQKGKVYKFDDVNCMLNFYNDTENNAEQFKYKLVVDFSQPEKLITASDAFFLKSDEIKSPMASEIAAFESKDSMEKLKEEWNGIYLVWGEVVTQFKK